MVKINSNLIKDAVYKLCFDANVRLSERAYSKILSSHKENPSNKILRSVLRNAKIANDTKRPLCQDTGQVIVFLSIGQGVVIEGDSLTDVVDDAVRNCYKDHFFRKSVVKDALFNRENTKDNSPAIIHYEIFPGDELRIDVLIKGAGSENKSQSKMLLPTATKKEVMEFVSQVVLESGVSACPPLFIGVGIGGDIEKSAILAKKSLVQSNLQTKENEEFAGDIKELINKNVSNEFEGCYVLDVNLLSCATHIACMPVSVCINCHSLREASCIISGKSVKFLDSEYRFVDVEEVIDGDILEVDVSDVDSVRKLKSGQEVLLSGELYVARDAAHINLMKMIDRGEELPIQIKDKIIFYAGPCPKADGEVIGPIGPTTSSRMDKFAPKLYDMGLLATIGKGERSDELSDAIKKNNAVYFSLIGGIASLLSSKVKKCSTIAFEELGAEALYLIEVKDFPVRVEIAG